MAEILLDKPKKLFLDIETFSLVGDSWSMWKTNILRVRRWSSICAFSAKWQGGKHITRALPDYPGYTPNSVDDRAIVLELWGLLNEADIVIAHNGDDFDFRKINARIIKHGLLPPVPYKTVDTKKVAKRHFRFDSNSLNNLADYLGIGRKKQTGGYDLWDECLAGVKSAWARMKDYNKHDVVLLEKVYDRMLPWIDNHPNLGLWSPGACSNCGSHNHQSRGPARTSTRIYKRFQCNDCGKWLRSTRSIARTDVTSHG